MGGGGDASQPIIDVGGVKLFSRAVSGVDAKDLKGSSTTPKSWSAPA